MCEKQESKAFWTTNKAKMEVCARVVVLSVRCGVVFGVCVFVSVDV